MIDPLFVFNSILLGVGLAMDAFSVSLANAMFEPDMTHRKMVLVAGTYAGFQFLMPVIGWICVHTVVEAFAAFDDFVPWIALALLCFIGGKMIFESLHGESGEGTVKKLAFGTLMLQGVATSIDALSVGFTIADYDTAAAITASLIIAAVTFALCMTGLRIGKIAGTKWSGRAQIVGGVILIGIGIEIAVTHFI